VKTISSAIENQVFVLQDMEKVLKPMGFVIGGNWDYDHGSFDYKLATDGGYQFLRIPFKTEDGELDQDGAIVRIQKPYMLTHVYQGDEDHAAIGNFTATVNQFQEPIEKDAHVPEEYMKKGRSLIKQVESALLGIRN